MGTQKRITITGIIIICLLVAACAPPPRNNVVTIGMVISPDEYGLNILKGAQLAVTEVGLENVRFFVEKSSCDAQKAADSIAEKLISLRKVQVIIEGVCSELAIALTPVAAEQNTVMISAVLSSTSALSSPWVFRTIPSDGAEAAFAADLLVQQKHKNAAIIYQNDEGGTAAKNTFEQKLASQGGRMVAAESFEKESLKFVDQLEAIADSAATAAYITIPSPASAKLFLQQRQERGLSIRVYGSKWFKSSEVLKLREAAQGLMVISPRLGNVGFITKYNETYGEEPGLFAAQGYDAYKALAQVLQQGARSSEEIRKALLNIEFQGASGLIDFDERGEVGANFEVYVVSEGRFEPQ